MCVWVFLDISFFADITMVKESAVVIIAVGEPASGEQPNIQHNLEIFRKVIPAIAKFACRAILLITTRPIEIMTYITWKLSNFPSSRVLGTGTLVDTVRLQYHLAQRMGVANTSISCMIIGTQGDTSGELKNKEIRIKNNIVKRIYINVYFFFLLFYYNFELLTDVFSSNLVECTCGWNEIERDKSQDGREK